MREVSDGFLLNSGRTLATDKSGVDSSESNLVRETGEWWKFGS